MKKRYSYLILPIKILTDLIILNLVVIFFSVKSTIGYDFFIYQNLFWLITANIIGFYKVYRHTALLRIVNLLFNQFSIFLLGYFAYFGIFKEGEIVHRQFVTLAYIFILVSLIKISWYILLKKYRSFGNNYRTVVILGYDQSTKSIIKLFKSKSNLGYKYLGFFSTKTYKNKEYLGAFKDVFKYINKNEVDEIYCSLKEHSQEQIKSINKFTTDYNITLKLIPDTKELYSKNQSVEYYNDTLMVLNVRKLPFDFKENFFLKRVFDICFSVIVCVFFLTWIVPIIWVLVKLESKGPLIFKQKREGLNGEKFTCFKFRSMRINPESDKVHATKNDARITKIGAILRKTSLDELPQFINVLFGDMSVVGPRPHIESLSLEYQKEVHDYLKRHIVKPGITGLAQVSGYRGEIKTRTDIKNRVRLDIFYIENWSFFLDTKIIIKTMLNVFKGEEKAY